MWVKGQCGRPGSHPPVEIPCDECGAVFAKHQSHIKAHNFCTMACYAEYLRGRRHSPEQCANMSAALSGDRGPNWKGGVSRQYKRGYKSEQFKRWRMAVFQRDSYTCRGCEKRGGYLTAHHLRSFALHPDLRYDVSNGRTLCEDCHARVDNYYHRLHPTKGGGENGLA